MAKTVKETNKLIISILENTDLLEFKKGTFLNLAEEEINFRTQWRIVFQPTPSNKCRLLIGLICETHNIVSVLSIRVDTIGDNCTLEESCQLEDLIVEVNNLGYAIQMAFNE